MTTTNPIIIGREESEKEAEVPMTTTTALLLVAEVEAEAGQRRLELRTGQVNSGDLSG